MAGRIRWYRRLIAPIAVATSVFLMAAPTGFAADPDIFVPSDSAVALAAGAGPTALSSGADLYAVGGGKTALGTESFDLSAHTGPNGDFGHWGTKVYSPTGDLIVRYKVDVDCINVHGPGKRAVIKGFVKTVEPSPNTLSIDVGDAVILGVDDEGNPGDAVPLDDWFNPNGDVFPGLSCKSITYIANVNNVTQGNINIKAP
jgi:hypothetical protein